MTKPPGPSTLGPPGCRHYRIIAVESLGVLEDVDRLAYLCLDCDAQLPATFASPANP